MRWGMAETTGSCVMYWLHSKKTAQQSADANTECAMTSALTHFRERSRDSLLMADVCSTSSGSTHVLNTMRKRSEGGPLARGAPPR